MCELAYRWFSPPDGVVLDPFAGGSVRGVVATKLGRRYRGCDLRAEQVEANQQQWEMMKDLGPSPMWVCGDSRDIHQHYAGLEADFIFSCPPYADLEVYSNDPADISTLGYDDFIAVYRLIIANAVSLLKNDRFACFVVGEVRDKKGIYRNFVSDTISAFVDAGTRYYNEAILVTPAGSLPLRAGKTFSSSRKLGKTHQNVLVFVKGDPKKATKACGEIEVAEMAAALDGAV
ncbi:DNA methyltransferase [Serratia fonticola]|uniref:DNA methyltransferase n=1 Tax=Serratia fonticola TaxID=47917 RepID=UPI0036F20A39